MHFRLLACLVTVLGLVSFACAVPTISARDNPTFTVTFLDQNNPVGSLGKLSERPVGLPGKIEEFFNNEAVRLGMGYKKPRSAITRWSVSALDDTYLVHIDKPPVYAGIKGGTQCLVLHKCLAIVVDGSVGMITRPSKVVVQVGNPAIVSFTNWGTKVASSEQDKSLVELAGHKVEWLLKEQNVKAALGFTGDPKIVHVDELPHDGFQTQPDLHFQLYGGMKCSPTMPCEALIVQTDHHGTLTATISDHKQKPIVEAQWIPPHQS